MSRQLAALVVLAGCNAQLGTTSTDAQGSAQDARADAQEQQPIDAMVDASPIGAWTTPAPVTGASDINQNIDDETLSQAQTEIYFGMVDATGAKQLYMMTRASAAQPWGTPSKLDATFNVTTTTPPPPEESPRLSTDDKTIYFGRNGDIYYATRTAVGAAWSTPQPLTEVNTTAYEKWFAPCNGGYYLVSRAVANNGQDLFDGQLGVTAPTASTNLNSTASETGAFLTNDCLTTYFASNRNTNFGMYTATRATPSSPWPVADMVIDFNVTYSNEDPWLAPDTRTFCFASIRNGTNTNKAIYCSTR